MRRLPNSIVATIHAAIAASLTACASAPSLRPALYGIELEECNRTAHSCDESIACENRVRLKYSRPMRTGGCS